MTPDPLSPTAIPSAAAAPPRRPAAGPARVAIVHDWLVTFGGAERVLAELLRIYPEATLFTLIDFFSAAEKERLGAREIRTSFLQRMPLVRTSYRRYLPLMPIAIEQFDLGGFDLVVSSTHAVAQGVITHPAQIHLAYVNSTMRYAWENSRADLSATGLGSGLRSVAARAALHRVRQWDWLAFQRPQAIAANSAYQARRLARTYRREAAVIFPPVAVAAVPYRDEKEDFYLFAGRLVPYKRADLLLDVFARLGRTLVIAGDGPERPRLQRRATSNVRFLGWQPAAELADCMARARALLLPADEPFGIVAVEAQAAGTPVIAYAGSGAAEALRTLDGPDPTGCLFHRQDPEAIAEAVSRLESERGRIRPEACRQNALRFSPERFAEAFRAYAESVAGAQLCAPAGVGASVAGLR